MFGTKFFEPLILGNHNSSERGRIGRSINKERKKCGYDINYIYIVLYIIYIQIHMHPISLIGKFMVYSCSL